MQALKVEYEPSSGAVTPIQGSAPEPWDAVCERFDNDVQRVKDVTERQGYTALYACYDENNQAVYYLVEEDEMLMKLRKQTFLQKLGRPTS